MKYTREFILEQLKDKQEIILLFDIEGMNITHEYFENTKNNIREELGYNPEFSYELFIDDGLFLRVKRNREIERMRVYFNGEERLNISNNKETD